MTATTDDGAIMNEGDTTVPLIYLGKFLYMYDRLLRLSLFCIKDDDFPLENTPELNVRGWNEME